MKFGLLVPNWAPFDQTSMLEVGLEAEALGFDHVFYTDHLMNPHTASDNLPDTTVETLTFLGFLGARTESIRIGVGVAPMALRAPALLAKQMATLDNLVGGRLDVGLGTGWAPESFGLLGRPLPGTPERIGRLREGVEVMLRLWHEDYVDFQGTYYSVNHGLIAPKPVQQPHPPLLFGGFGQSMLSLTATFGDGWIPWHRQSDHYARCLEEIRRLETVAGREVPVTAGTVTMIVPDALGKVAMDMGQGPPPNITVSQSRDAVAAYAAAGCELFLVFLFPAEGVMATLRALAKRLLV